MRVVKPRAGSRPLHAVESNLCPGRDVVRCGPAAVDLELGVEMPVLGAAELDDAGAAGEEGQQDEARKILATVDETKIADPAIFLNAGIALVNERKHAEAIVWFDKAIARFPQHADGYYYRGISYLATGKQPEAKADLEQFVAMAKPDAPELPIAKKILESMK